MNINLLASLITLCICCQTTRSMDNLKVAYEWKILDFDYPSEEARQAAIQSKEFIPKNNLPLGLEVYEDRLFVTVPRWKSGVAASLAYINMSTDPMESPKLHPYPNWESHKFFGDSPPQIVSPFRVRADRCGRLWVLDTGTADLLETSAREVLTPRVLIYDLHNDQLLRTYEIPADQMKKTSFLANIAVEDQDCQDSYAYLADLGAPSLIVYSYKSQRSWVVKHNYFNINPLAGEMNVSGVNFEWTDGIFGLALSGPDQDGYSTLYFHPMMGFDEFAVSTRILRNETLTKNSFHEFKHLGSRGPKSQSGASFLDQKSNVLFYSLLNLNAVACWRTTNKAYTMESQGRIFMSNVSMVFPNDIKVDSNDNLWVLSDKLPLFMYRELDYKEVNFRILKAKVADAIQGSACDSKLVLNPDIMNKMPPVLNVSTPIVSTNIRQNSGCSQIKISLFSFISAVFFLLLRNGM